MKTVRNFFLHCNFCLADFGNWNALNAKNQLTKTLLKPTSVSEFKGSILHTADEKEQHIKQPFLPLNRAQEMEVVFFKSEWLKFCLQRVFLGFPPRRSETSRFTSIALLIGAIQWH